MGKARKEHAHEAYAREVVDGAYLLLVLPEWYAELVPCGGTLLTVAQCRCVYSFVNNMVLSHHHVLRSYAHMVLEVFLILVERIVLVYVLYVGSGLV